MLRADTSRLVTHVPVMSSTHVPSVEILLGSQIGLRQRRTAERHAVFLADEQHPAGESLLPQGRGGVTAGNAAAHDHERPLA
jgi:hypothetical protein